MFNKFFYDIKNLNKRLIENYVKFLFYNTYKFIVVYIVINVVLNMCLMKLHVTQDAQKLTFTRQSESFKMMPEINSLFHYNANESHFTHRLTDFGYFVDIIIKSKTNDTNLINQNVLDEYNQLFAHIMNLTIVDSGKTYGYRDLCAKRLDKCAIEGQRVIFLSSVCFFYYLDFCSRWNIEPEEVSNRSTQPQYHLPDQRPPWRLHGHRSE